MGASQAPQQPPAPDDINIRIVGTASFQGRQTALIEDCNTNAGSFYRVGDPIYGYKIAAIGTDGLQLEKAGKAFFVGFRPAVSSVPGVEPPSKPPGTAIASTTIKPGTKPNFYTSRPKPNFYSDSPASTKWDLWTEPEAKSNTVAQVDVGGRFAFPLSRGFKRMSSGFGYREHPIGGGTKMHKGMDLSARQGTKIYAADNGTVTFSGWRGGYGNCLIVDHQNGYTTTYAHCRKLVADVGDHVRRGDFVAEVGSTGASTGPHLHFEVRKGDVPVDPGQFFKGGI